MIQQITWLAFWVVTIGVTLLWYLGVVLLFYRSELFGLLGGRQQITSNEFRKTAPLPHRWEKGVEELSIDAGLEMELMGKAKLPEGMLLVSDGDFGFAGGDKDREDQLGLVPDLLAELKAIFADLEKNDAINVIFWTGW